jgi:hypothetical protein
MLCAAASQAKVMDVVAGIEGMMDNIVNYLKPLTRCTDDDVSSLPVDSVKGLKKRKLENKQSVLMGQIKFQKELGEDYHDKYKEWLEVCDQLSALVAEDED